MADRLLTDEEFIKLRPAFAGVDKIVLQAQDLKSVKAVIEEIEAIKSACGFTCDKAEFSECRYKFARTYCKAWQQFKERVK